MRVPLEWLKEHVAVKLSPAALAERLTMAGATVEAVTDWPSGPVLELEVTPNRPDWLSIIGIAREVAAVTGQRLTLPSAQGSRLKAQGGRRTPSAFSLQPSTSLTIRIDDRKGCARYIGRLLEGVTVKSSPGWMQQRLAACGLRPINNLVDITNYVLFECGQPLHAFDADRLRERTIRVRRAAANEPITTLDGVKRLLTPEMLVIADAQAPVAVAGVMGGHGTEVTEQTRRVVLESALFDPVTVRRTARQLGLASESSYRFERGVDPEGVARASQRAAQLIMELAGGRETAVCDTGAKAAARVAITVDPLRARRWLGMPMDAPAMRTALARLGCRVASSGAGGPLRVSPPTYRRDLAIDVDVYEELARAAGYDRIPSSIPSAPLAHTAEPASSTYERVQQARRCCAGLGLTEAVTWSLVSEADLARCGFAASEAVRLANPLSQDHAYLQPSLVLGLLRVLRHNVSRGTTVVSVFEIGRVRRGGEERPRLGVMISGAWCPDWAVPRQAADFFVLKGVLGVVARQMSGVALEFSPARHGWSEAGEGAQIALEGHPVGVAGAVSRKTLEAYDLKQPAWFGEVALDVLLAAPRRPAAIAAPPEFPPVKRDLSVLLDAATPYREVERLIREAAGTLAGRVELIDRFTGKQVPAGRQSLTFSLEYRDPARTLTAAEADAAHQRVTQALVERLGAVRR